MNNAMNMTMNVNVRIPGLASARHQTVMIMTAASRAPQRPSQKRVVEEPRHAAEALRPPWRIMTNICVMSSETRIPLVTGALSRNMGRTRAATAWCAVVRRRPPQLAAST